MHGTFYLTAILVFPERLLPSLWVGGMGLQQPEPAYKLSTESLFLCRSLGPVSGVCCPGIEVAVVRAG